MATLTISQELLADVALDDEGLTVFLDREDGTEVADVSFSFDDLYDAVRSAYGLEDGTAGAPEKDNVRNIIAALRELANDLESDLNDEE